MSEYVSDEYIAHITTNLLTRRGLSASEARSSRRSYRGYNKEYQQEYNARKRDELETAKTTIGPEQWRELMAEAKAKLGNG